MARFSCDCAVFDDATQWVVLSNDESLNCLPVRQNLLAVDRALSYEFRDMYRKDVWKSELYWDVR